MTSDTPRSTGNCGCSYAPDGPISRRMHVYAVEIAAQLQKLPQTSFEAASPALKGLFAEIDRVADMESTIPVSTFVSKEHA
ncbi:hypothetical protein [Oleidesulfovibrio sp.]|uniref:hypothetical protein n=1 Tax=Oleidesulfovibrio sp. TaxID=2909707 RepID=UPI003A875C4C